MKFYRTHGSIAGFHVENTSDPLVPVRMAGEVWMRNDWRIQWHRDPGWELFYQERGESRWQVGRQLYTVHAQGFYLIREGVNHRLLSLKGAEPHFFFLIFSDKFLGAEIRRELREFGNAHFSGGGWSLGLPFRSLMRSICISGVPFIQREILKAHVACLAASVAGLRAPFQECRPVFGHPAALKARDLLDSHPGHAWKLDELAALCGISPKHLIAVFQREFRLTPHAFLIQARLEEAARRLRESEASITEVALNMGFGSSQHFANAFKKHFASSPTQFRARKSMRSPSHLK